MDQPQLIGATDYRQFLLDYYTLKKDSGRPFSYRQFSKKCGFSSPNFLKLVIEGKRNLSPESVEKVVAALELKGNEASYFRTLVLLNQAQQLELKKVLYEQLKALTPYAKRRDLDSDSVEYLSHWLYPVLREMCLQDDFQDDPYWITRRLHGRVTVRDVTKGLQFLRSSGFFKKDENGKYSCPENIVLSSDEVKSLAIRQFHKNILGQSQEMLDDIPMEEREFGSLIIRLPASSIAELKERLKSFRKELHEWAINQAEGGENCDVVQFNFQMFPQTKRLKNNS